MLYPHMVLLFNVSPVTSVILLLKRRWRSLSRRIKVSSDISDSNLHGLINVQLDLLLWPTRETPCAVSVLLVLVVIWQTWTRTLVILIVLSGSSVLWMIVSFPSMSLSTLSIWDWLDNSCYSPNHHPGDVPNCWCCLYDFGQCRLWSRGLPCSYPFPLDGGATLHGKWDLKFRFGVLNCFNEKLILGRSSWPKLFLMRTLLIYK